MEAIARLFSPQAALDAARDRSGSTYDPDLAELFAEHGSGWLDRLAKTDPWDAVLDLEPTPHRTLEGDALDVALLVVADFIDLKSPYMAGHSRRSADLCAQAARLLGFTEESVRNLQRAVLVQEFGTTAVPNSIWDKPGQLTRAEVDRVQLHTMLTEQMLRRSAALAALNPVAAAHHEKVDGSGYHKCLTAEGVEPGAQIAAVADIYVGLTSDRADRQAFTGQSAAAEVRRLVADGVLDARAADAVLVVAGHHGAPTKPRRARQPGGLTAREVQVLRLAARGLTTRQISEQLFISAKTADHHIQHCYTKIGVSTRAAAALWAMQNGIVA